MCSETVSTSINLYIFAFLSYSTRLTCVLNIVWEDMLCLSLDFGWEMPNNFPNKDLISWPVSRDMAHESPDII